MESKTDPTMGLGTLSRSIEIGLRAIGVWPNSSYMILGRAFWMITLTMAQTFQYRYFLIHVRTDDLPHLMDGLSVTMSYSLLLLKLIVFWIHRRRFYDILNTMARDRSECVTNWAVSSMSRTVYISHRSSNVIIGLYPMSVFLYGTGVLVASPDEVKEVDEPQTRELILKMELPFETNTSPVYEIVMVTQFIHQVAAAALVGVLNALIVSLILHVGGQIDIMCRGLAEISSGDNAFDLRASAIRALICRHQRIIALSTNIENLFSYIALMQFLGNTLVICSLGFIIVTSIGTTEGTTMLIKSLFFYAVITFEAFIFCYAGEYLSAKSKMIGDAAYEAKWYKSSPTQSRVLLLLILRSQRKLTITIGKFMDLSLDRFTTIIKASASYVSVLHAMS
ncbi:odorant receptor 4-like [Pseudomyrmex gracilis]|uniref:odorant receptor 4-like n=1 Tax=Pseudomyrmex gracilis TaxID=219809 RepID=UPI000994EAE2|nr:odorant receptor 4-like [Pseudomyrmex gracilis]